MEERIKGTRSIAERAEAADARFRETLELLGGLTKEQAARAFVVLDRAKVLRRDYVVGHVSVKHGSFLEREVLQRAAAS